MLLICKTCLFCFIFFVFSVGFIKLPSSSSSSLSSWVQIFMTVLFWLNVSSCVGYNPSRLFTSSHQQFCLGMTKSNVKWVLYATWTFAWPQLANQNQPTTHNCCMKSLLITYCGQSVEKSQVTIYIWNFTFFLSFHYF